MDNLKERILNCKTANELNSLKLLTVKDKQNFKENQMAFIKMKNKFQQMPLRERPKDFGAIYNPEIEQQKDIEVADKLISKLIYYVEIEEGSIDALRNCMASHKALGEAKEILGEPYTHTPIGCGSSYKYYLKQDVEPFVAKLKLERDEARKLIFQHKGGEDDGYGGKTEPITWKEAYEEQEEYESWAMKEMRTACELIKKHPDWKRGKNAYPSPFERAIVAGCGQAVKDLKAENAQLKQTHSAQFKRVELQQAKIKEYINV